MRMSPSLSLQVTDELVDVLLTPLLTDGAADVVFDTLSYSAGPLPEQLLADDRLTAPVLVCYGEKDPWTPAARVRALERFERVQRVVPLPDVGHCPHDEAPDIVNPLVLDFVRACADAPPPTATVGS
jgi:pimeloyl-ACP methyl ester carboxylesterase